MSRFLCRLGGASPTLLLVTIAFGQALPDPPGPYCPVSATEVAQIPSFTSGDRKIAAYYFYWYKWADACANGLCDPVYARAHILFATGFNGSPKPVDALTDHPFGNKSWNYEDFKWHFRELGTMKSAGIDIVLPVFWGVPGRYGEGGHNAAAWSSIGLKALSEALQFMEKHNIPVPRIGMFYDTSTLTFESPFNYQQGNKMDLRTEVGWKHFYATIRDFYSIISPRFWALWENRPLIWLYSSEFASGHDDKVLKYAREHFAQDFGGLNPIFVAHTDWKPEAGADWIYQWGGAIKPTYLSVNSIGPGFDNSAVFGKPRGSHVLRERESGKFYKDAWERAVRSPAPITVIETWNELHEATEICPTIEHGNEYVEITNDFKTMFWRPNEVKPLPGPFQGAGVVSWEGGGASKGIEPIGAEDGRFGRVNTADGTVLEMASNYLYFAVDDSYCFCCKQPQSLEVEYFGLPFGQGPTSADNTATMSIEYDSWDRKANYYGIYKTTEALPIDRKIGWKTARYTLEDARLANNQNAMADFRIVAPKGLRVRKVTLSR